VIFRVFFDNISLTAKEVLLELCIWWLTQMDCAHITEGLIEKLPEYIAQEYRSRQGRAGRGRLWVAETFGEVDCTWSDDNPVCRMLTQLSAGGIVFVASDICALPKNIGVVTDLNGNLLPTCPTCGGIATKDGDSTFGGVAVYECGNCRVQCDHDSDCKRPLLFTICNKEGRPDGYIRVCNPHNHS
jgi:hypothetical protein